MPAPTSYSEKTLADFMAACLQDVATTLGWTVGAADAGSYQEAVNETLLAYDVTTIVGATEIGKLRALARREVWRQAMAATAGDYDTVEEQQDLKRSQAHKQAVAQYQLAVTAALPYDAAYRVKVATVSYRQDPYAYVPDELRGAP